VLRQAARGQLGSLDIRRVFIRCDFASYDFFAITIHLLTRVDGFDLIWPSVIVIHHV
jgi:hypothetical protein